ncbi:MAG TPA: ABC transporter permease [Bacillota bacterium]|nr:ABC transporter permease [Bacillota bacterium]HPV12672.1 ABC transporter permease [Bacillota bacterium]
MKTDKRFEILRTGVAIGVALLIGFIVTCLVSEAPLKAFGYFLRGPFTTTRRFAAFLEAAIPLTFSGLAISLVFSAGQFNLGAEGQFFIGAVAATAAGIYLDLPPVIHTLVCLLAGIAAGAVAGFIPGILKAKWNASELVSSLMLNYVFLKLGMYLVTYHMRDQSVGALVSLPLKETSLLTQFIPNTRIHTGVFILLITVLFCYYYLFRTSQGYEVRMTGQNIEFARYSGIPVLSVILSVQVLAGAIAGLGGAVEMLGIYKRFQWLASPGYGFDGVIVATLAKNNPALVPVTALFLAYLRVGADVMAIYSDVSAEMVAIIQAVIILLVTAEAFLSGYRRRMLLREVKQSASAS